MKADWLQRRADYQKVLIDTKKDKNSAAHDESDSDFKQYLVPALAFAAAIVLISLARASK